MADKIGQLISECEQDVEYQTRVKTLLTQLNEAKQRQNIQEYQHLYRQLLNKQVDIYTVPYSSTRLIPPPGQRNRDNDAEFWFDYKGQEQQQ